MCSPWCRRFCSCTLRQTFIEQFHYPRTLRLLSSSTPRCTSAPTQNMPPKITHHASRLWERHGHFLRSLLPSCRPPMPARGHSVYCLHISSPPPGLSLLWRLVCACISANTQGSSLYSLIVFENPRQDTLSLSILSRWSTQTLVFLRRQRWPLHRLPSLR